MEFISALLVGVVFSVVFLSYFVNHRIAGMHLANTELTLQSARLLSALVALPVQLEKLIESTQRMNTDPNDPAQLAVLQRSISTIDGLLNHIRQVNHTFKNENVPHPLQYIIHRLLVYGTQVELDAKKLKDTPQAVTRLSGELIVRARSFQAVIVEQHASILSALESAATTEHAHANDLLILQYSVLVIVPPLIAVFLLYQTLLANRSEVLAQEKAWYVTQLESKQGTLEVQRRELASTRDEAIHASQAKSAFLANMSHEIRTPLTAIIGFSESLLAHTGTASEQLDALNTVHRSAKHLLQIINDILDLSKIEAEKLRIDPIETSLFTIVDDVKHICNLQADLKGLELITQFEFPLPERFTADPLRLKQVLLNLTNNAIKFTERGSVTIQSGYIHEHGEVWFSIKDTGIGITPEQMDRLFSAFTQADVSTTRRYGGTGLGLYLCEKLVGLLGGEMTVTSEANHGTTIRFTAHAPQVPGCQQIMNTKGMPVSHSDSSTAVAKFMCSGHVLVAEDNPDNQKLIGLYLKRMGLEFSFAENGQRTVDMAFARKYDLILMDMQMPVLDGYQATGLLRQRGHTGPIVALTANALREDVDKAKNAGCTDFLAKPIDQIKFVHVISHYLRNTVDEPTTTTAPKPIRSTLVDDDPELSAITASFARGLPEIITRLRELHQTGSWESLGHALHDLKGSSGNFGFGELQEIAALGDKAIRLHAYDSLQPLIDQLVLIEKRVTLGLSNDQNDVYADNAQSAKQEG